MKTVKVTLGCDGSRKEHPVLQAAQWALFKWPGHTSQYSRPCLAFSHRARIPGPEIWGKRGIQIFHLVSIKQELYNNSKITVSCRPIPLSQSQESHTALSWRNPFAFSLSVSWDILSLYVDLLACNRSNFQKHSCSGPQSPTFCWHRTVLESLTLFYFLCIHCLIL